MDSDSPAPRRGTSRQTLILAVLFSAVIGFQITSARRNASDHDAMVGALTSTMTNQEALAKSLGVALDQLAALREEQVALKERVRVLEAR